MVIRIVLGSRVVTVTSVISKSFLGIGQPLVDSGLTEVETSSRLLYRETVYCDEAQHFRSRLVIQTIGWVIG
jgi:hypothetical protein